MLDAQPGRNPSQFQYFATGVVITLVILLFGNPAVARTNPNDIDFKCSFGFGGYFKVESPTPINFTIHNRGDLFEGWVVADLNGWIPPTYFNHPVTATPGSTTTSQISCFGCYGYQDAPCLVSVNLLDKNGDAIKSESLSPSLLREADTLLVHLDNSEEPDGFDNLFGDYNPGYLSMVAHDIFVSPGLVDYPPRIFPVEMRADELPENVFLIEGIGCIAISLDYFLLLDKPLHDRLLEYVSHGGNLVVYFDGNNGQSNLAWDHDPLLPVTSSGEVKTVGTTEIMVTIDGVVKIEELTQHINERYEQFRRGIRGEVIPPADMGTESDNTLDYNMIIFETDSVEWDFPDRYQVIVTDLDNANDTVLDSQTETPLLVSKNIGNGRVGFVAFNPFEGNPGALDKPVILLAAYGFLDPTCPVRDLNPIAIQTYRGFNDSTIQAFFRQGMGYTENPMMRWLEALGPALIYLLVLPILVIAAKRRGNVILALFVIWSVFFTGLVLYSRARPVDDRVLINGASFVWCNALSRSDSANSDPPASHIYTTFSYSSTSTAPHTLSWDYPGAILDETVNPAVWPYGTVTVENSRIARLPDLPLEGVIFNAEGPGERTFILRRPSTEIKAKGELRIGPDTARLVLDAQMPFDSVAGRLMVGSHRSVWVGKNFGALGKEIHLDTGLKNGAEIIRHESLFPGRDFETGDTIFPDGETGENKTDLEMGYLLQTLWNQAVSMPVGRSQFYSQSRVTGNPNLAYLLLATTGIPSKAQSDHGKVDEHSVTIVVITIPIVYEN